MGNFAGIDLGKPRGQMIKVITSLNLVSVAGPAPQRIQA